MSYTGTEVKFSDAQDRERVGLVIGQSSCPWTWQTTYIILCDDRHMTIPAGRVVGPAGRPFKTREG